MGFHEDMDGRNVPTASGGNRRRDINLIHERPGEGVAEYNKRIMLSGCRLPLQVLCGMCEVNLTVGQDNIILAVIGIYFITVD